MLKPSILTRDLPKLIPTKARLYLCAALAAAAVALIQLTGATPVPPAALGSDAKAAGLAGLCFPRLEGEEAVARLRQQGRYDALAEAMQAARYSFNPVERPEELGLAPGSYYVNNPAQQYRAFFAADGVRIVPQAEGRPWQMGVRLVGCGYGERVQPVGEARLKATPARVEYRRGDDNGSGEQLIEWYVNRPEGLEQGFTISTPPAGKREGERLAVALAVAGELRPSLDERGQAVRLSRTDGAGVLSFEKLWAKDAAGRELEARMRLDGGRILLEVDDAGAVYPVTIDPTFAELQKLTAGDADIEDMFGSAVAIDGDTVVIGARRDGHAGGIDAGSAYVFVREGASWSLQQKLTASDAGASDQFGWSVAISGETIVAGALANNNAGGESAGAAYVFVRAGASWSQQQKLTASDGAPYDRFGSTVAINGERIVVSSIYNNEAGAEAGAAYVFVRAGASWSQQQKLIASDAAAGDWFGYSVAISGEMLVIGAYNDDNAGGADAGAVYVFANTGAAWSQQQKLTASDAAAGDWFGWSVAISGETLVISAYADDTLGGTNAGSAYIFVKTGATWSQQQKLTASDGLANDLFGNSVAISGETIIIGALDADNGVSVDVGAVYVFANTGAAWSQQQKLTASDGAMDDWFGVPVAISGDTVVIGAPLHNTTGLKDAGAAYIFYPPCAGVTCPNDITQSADAGQCSAAVSYSLPDNDAACGTISCDHPSGSVFPVGITVVTCTSGAGPACNFTVTVTDGEAPTINCKAVAAQSASANLGCQAMVPDVRGLVRAQSLDNCTAQASLVVTQSPVQGFMVAGTGPHSITVTVKDAANNSATCVVAFTVTDNTPPQIVCPPNLNTTTAAGQCAATVNPGMAAASDNCGVPSITGTRGDKQPLNAPYAKGTTTITWKATDASGNTATCVQTVTVIDAQAPQIVCPANMTASLAPTCPPVGGSVITFTTPNMGAGTLSDNCPGVTAVCSPPSGSVFTVGTTTVTCTATDASANVATCSFTVTVFTGCLQDDSQAGNIVLFDHATGVYKFCCQGVVVASGVGMLTVKGCLVTIEHNTADRRVLIKADFATKKGNASVQTPPGVVKCAITDQNMGNNSCQCGS
jgi:hypothetical protein